MPQTRRTATRSIEPRSPQRQQHDAPQSSTRSASHSARSPSLDPSNPSKRPRRVDVPQRVVEEEHLAPSHVAQRDANIDSDDDLEAPSSSDSESSLSPSSDDAEDILGELDRELIVDNLAPMVRDSLQIVSLFNPHHLPTLLTNIRSPKSSLGRRLKNFDARLRASAEPCRPTGALIRPDLIGSKLANSSEIMGALWPTDAALYLVNLAVVLSDLVGKNELSMLEILAQTFPETFLSSGFQSSDAKGAVMGTTRLASTIEIALSIRTQYFLHNVERFQNSESFDPDSVLSQVFFDESDLLGFESSQGNSFYQEFVVASETRIKDIRKRFTTDGRSPVRLGALRKKYPYDDFLAKFIVWADLRAQELQAQIASVGGLESILQNLEPDGDGDSEEMAGVEEKEVATGIADHAAPVSSVSEDSSRLAPSRQLDRMQSMRKRMPGFKRRSNKEDSQEQLNEAVAKEKNLPADRPARREVRESPVLGDAPVDNHADEEIPPSAQGDNSLQQDEIHVSSVPRPTRDGDRPHPEIELLIDASQRQMELGNKENLNVDARAHSKVLNPEERNAAVSMPKGKRKFTDRQEGATRVVWGNEEDEADGDGFETVVQKRRRIEPSRAPRRAQARSVSEPASEGDEGESHERDGRHQHRSHGSRAEISGVGGRHPTQAENTGASRATEAPSSTAPARSESNSVPLSTQLREANMSAKNNVRQLKAELDPHAAQVRRAWETEETVRLVELVGIYETRWSTMLDEDRVHPDGPRLQRRTQVNLKDKARNIKMDCLKGLRPLPAGFAAVSIKNSDRDQLRRLGIPVDEDE